MSITTSDDSGRKAVRKSWGNSVFSRLIGQWIEKIIARDPLLPPPELIREHSGDISPETFAAMGEEIVCHSLIREAGFSPSGRLLDIGCGCGKIARPLTSYLLPDGGYDGVDITHAAIDWCRKAYRPYPNFRFHLSNVQSSRYNAVGDAPASAYRFPFEPDLFDVVFLGSVFTHMLPADTAHYLREISRVMKPGGRCLATFFLLDDTARQNIASGKTVPSFVHTYGHTGCRIEVKAIPEAAIAYEESFVRTLHQHAGLSVDAVNFGQWGRGKLIAHWQDEVWSSKQ